MMCCRKQRCVAGNRDVLQKTEKIKEHYYKWSERMIREPTGGSLANKKLTHDETYYKNSVKMCFWVASL